MRQSAGTRVSAKSGRRPSFAEMQARVAALEAELAEALEQQTATAEVLGVINSSPGELAPVFDAMLERAMRLCEAAFGHLDTYDGNSFHTAAIRGVPAAYAGYRGNNPPIYGPGTGPARMLAGERIVHHLDMMEEEAYRRGEPNRRALVELGGARSAINMALVKDGTFLGFITLFRREVRPFTDKQIALVENFAAQAVIAIENARLITETREALEQQTATAEVLGVINSSPGDLAPVFDAILEKALGLCEAAFGSMARFDGEAFDWVATHGVPEAWFAEFKVSGYRPAPALALYRFMHDGEDIEHVADIAADDSGRSAIPDRRRFAELTEARTAIWIALRKDRALRGALIIYRREVRPFTDKQIALLQNFAAQAVIAMENARLITETREALDQQTATAEVLGVINSSPGDLAPVFDAMLEKAMRLCEANFGFLSTYDGEHFDAVGLHGLPEKYVQEYLTGPYLPGPNTTHDRLVRGELVVHVPNLAVHDADSPRRRAVVEVLGVRSILAVPLRKDGVLLGAIHVYRKEIRPFSAKEIALLQNFAAQAVIAMENARLLVELRQRTVDLQEALDHQTATSDVLKIISRSTFDLRPVLGTVVETAARLCVADQAVIFRRDGELYGLAANCGFPAEYETYLRRRGPAEPPAHTVTGRAAREARVIHVHDVVADPDYPPTDIAITLGKQRTTLGVPLLREGEPIGVLLLARECVEPFTDRQIELVRTFADQAVIAMENARLLGELRQRNDQIAGWNKELEDRVAAQLGELERVGKLKRFLAPQLAELIVARGDEAVLETHRRDIVVVFCDLRDFTAFAETAEPEEVLDLLREYHAALGPVVSASEGTLDHFSGDGIMVFFNDPVPVADASERAVRMAVAMRAAMAGLQQQWGRQGRRIGFGAGIARGYATLGQIGFADRIDYTAIGTVCNLAARLCAEAKDGQILLSQRVAAAVEEAMPLEEMGEVALKGLSQPVAVYNVPLAGGQAALRVIEGGAPSA